MKQNFLLGPETGFREEKTEENRVRERQENERKREKRPIAVFLLSERERESEKEGKALKKQERKRDYSTNFGLLFKSTAFDSFSIPLSCSLSFSLSLFSVSLPTPGVSFWVLSPSDCIACKLNALHTKSEREKNPNTKHNTKHCFRNTDKHFETHTFSLCCFCFYLHYFLLCNSLLKIFLLFFCFFILFFFGFFKEFSSIQVLSFQSFFIFLYLVM